MKPILRSILIFSILLTLAAIWGYWLTMGQHNRADQQPKEPVSYTMIVVRCEPPLICEAEAIEYWSER